VRREARDRYDVGRPLLGTTGDLVVADLAGIRRLAARMNTARPAGPSVQAGDIGALGLIHEIAHLLIARYETDRMPGAISAALADLDHRLGPDARRLLDRFGREFPGVGPQPEPRELRLEELLLTRIANENPAVGPLLELVDDRDLVKGTRYRDAIVGLEATFAAGPPFDGDGLSLIELIRQPARQAPTSLAGQLRFIRSAWGGLLGGALDELIAQLDIAMGILAEEERALHFRFGGGGTGGWAGPGARVETPSFAAAADEPEAFSSDSAWMPRVVLIAKSTYVWLDQLSKAHGREIRTLDAIPDEELDALARWGVTGLWLIGLWERSEASERIKRMRGNADAVASAYSLDDYRIAADLGGEAAHASLRDRAWARGIRLASDMVPNHMGIDSRWVIDHPEWFLSLDEPPYPAYTFGGPDLSSVERVGIVLEDHYWDDSDAAVVFKRVDRATGSVRYVYHGNDGTSFPWNDTAQLDFLDPAVREQVIRTIIDVARHFPIIRFDAAMVLAKKHIQRLWWPEPGTAGGIPSRAEHAMSKREFDRRMPVEFWREVVDRVAAEAPDTLLLAEAFWLLEGYFVRTLGMHRVYNSAFMHMLRDEDGAGYRKVIKDTIEFDPAILQRYVNFMSNPDEKTAVEQFGKGDKYFGVATVLATLPGLPMLGHGQVQGFGEKYGMEFRRAMLDESLDPWLLERHEREIFPLFHRRAWFAGSDDFLLYDVVTEGGAVDESVLAYSNGHGPERSLVLYQTRFGSTRGRIRESAAYARRTSGGSRRLVRRSLAEGLGLPRDASSFVTFREARTGLEYVASCQEIWERGLPVHLDAYGVQVFWEFREVHDGTVGQWSRLARRLGGTGVPSLEDAIRESQLEPVHAPLRALFDTPVVRKALDGRPTVDDDGQERVKHAEMAGRLRAFYASVAEATGLTERAGSIDDLSAVVADGAGMALEPEPPMDRWEAAAMLASWLIAPMGDLAPGDPAATSRAWFDELRLAAPLAAGLRTVGLDEAQAWAAADLVRVLLHLPRPSQVRGPVRQRDAKLLERWLEDPTIRTAIGVNTWQGVEYVDRDRFTRMLHWAVRLDRAGGRRVRDRAMVDRLRATAEAAGYRIDALRATLLPPAPSTAPKKASTAVPGRAGDRPGPPRRRTCRGGRPPGAD
jgi:glycosidase